MHWYRLLDNKWKTVETKWLQALTEIDWGRDWMDRRMAGEVGRHAQVVRYWRISVGCWHVAVLVALGRRGTVYAPLSLHLPGWPGGGLTCETHKHANLPLTGTSLFKNHHRVVWKLDRRVIDIRAGRRGVLILKGQTLNKQRTLLGKTAWRLLASELAPSCDGNYTLGSEDAPHRLVNLVGRCF